jgi:hypothetical protein
LEVVNYLKLNLIEIIKFNNRDIMSLYNEYFGLSKEMLLDNTVIFQDYLQGPFALYAGWILIHYLAAHAYSTYCVNWSWYGFLSSPLITSTPICRGLSWVIYEGSNTISHVWVLIGTTLSVYLVKKRH